MDQLTSHVDPRSEAFTANAERMRQLVDEHRERLARIALGGGPRYLERHREQGKLPVRERIEKLLDPGIAVPRAVAAGRLRACTTTTRRRPASSPASAACRAAR